MIQTQIYMYSTLRMCVILEIKNLDYHGMSTKNEAILYGQIWFSFYANEKLWWLNTTVNTHEMKFHHFN